MKYTDEYIEKICAEQGIKFLGTFIKECTGNRRRKCFSFICDKHQKYGPQSLVVDKVDKIKKICPYCNHSRLKETFKNEVEEMNNNIEILSQYKNWNTKVTCRCKIHDYIWDALPAVLLYGGGCPICGHERTALSRRNSIEDIKERVYRHNPNIEIIGKYNGFKSYIDCHCLIDDTIWQSMVCHLVDGTAGCPTCNARRIRERCGLSQDEFEKRVSEVKPHLTIIGKYQNAYTPIEFQCKIHKCNFISSPHTILYKSGNDCPLCCQYQGERELCRVLEKYNINYNTQHTIPGMKYINSLKFDAYDLDKNIAYEYQGQQHYYPVDFAGKGSKWAQNQFEINTKRDNIKREFCCNNGITLIEIPYWDIENIESYIIK